VAGFVPRMGPVLRCTGLVKRFGDRTAVDDVSFEIGPGEAYGLLGPNGAGKTTAISMLVGLLDRDGGEVVVDGISLDDRPTAAKAAIGLVPQELALYPELTATENLTFFGRLYGLGGQTLARRVAETVEAVGLTDRAGDRVQTYSGGMKRRVNIAAGLLHEPRLLVLDEPTVGVDPQSRNAILETVEGLERAGMALLYTSHYMEEVERLCDRVGIMDEGRMVAEGTRRELVDRLEQRDVVLLTTGGDTSALAAAARGVEGVENVAVLPAEEDGDGATVTVTVADGPERLPALIAAASAADVAITSVEVAEPDLEAVFLHLTGKALRD
jgi:linearmycin/streptolysin S transport system ATP-binding protein